MAYKKKLFDANSTEAFKISRSKIDLFLECPRCFYLEQRLGVSRPRGAPFTLNVAVDHLLKKEFDVHRTDKTAHPLMKSYGIDAVPFAHKDIKIWRENFVGIQYHHKPDNLLITGAVDDVWQDNKTKELHVVDYKATAKDGEVKELEDSRWHNQYRRQMEVYQWLLRMIGFPVSPIGYFVYVNGKKDRAAFDGKLEFDVNLISYKGNDSWIPKILPKIKDCLSSSVLPPIGEICEYCLYRESAGKAIRDMVMASSPKIENPSPKTKKTGTGENPVKSQTLF